jgi:hypothetical protein
MSALSVSPADAQQSVGFLSEEAENLICDDEDCDGTGNACEK